MFDRSAADLNTVAGYPDEIAVDLCVACIAAMLRPNLINRHVINSSAIDNENMTKSVARERFKEEAP